MFNHNFTTWHQRAVAIIAPVADAFMPGNCGGRDIKQANPIATALIGGGRF